MIYGTGADADRVTALQMHKVNRIQFAYDGFGRVTSRTYSNTSGDNRRVTTYTYQDVGNGKTTTLLKTVNNSGFGLLGYEYDAVGNITQITKDGAVQESYTYDDLNQLKTVTRNGVTTEYNYQNGNITSVTQNGTAVKTYGYTDSTWGDLLTSFNGQTITYDEIGNPLQYRDGMSFTWAKGRQLQGITKDGLNASYTYDENGLRISKTVNGVTTKIFRTNGQMVGMNMSDGKDVTFILDGDGNVYGVHYDHYSANGLRPETYYFAFNAQGDVIGIYDFGGRLMATYDYDEWGNCTVNVLAADSNGHAIDSPDHVAHVNPFRYRGYFYDAETGFYYLNSRYYDPCTGRFMNADGVMQTGKGVLDKNMYTYCANNFIMFCDPNGYDFVIVFDAEGNSGKCEISDPNYNYQYSDRTYTVYPQNSYEGFLDALAEKESSNDYSKKNSQGYLGRYQMGNDALIEANFKDKNGNWTKLAEEYGVRSETDFLNCPAAQEAAIRAYHKRLRHYIKSFGLDDYIGSDYCGVKVTQSGLMASCHLVGAGAMKKSLSTGVVVWDGNHTEASEYMLSFGDYDISEVW